MSEINTLIGNEEWSNDPPYTQVFGATHKQTDESEWVRQSYMHRSFISFSFGGKWIEDFNLIATIENNRLQRTASAPHEDLVSNYEVLDGQFYWGTRFQPNQLELVLSTDGITENQLDDFKYWFCGGATRELILAEHPNRAIMARVGQTSNISMLPFEEKTTVKIAGQEYETSTTIYKGQIGMVLVMDEPFWYSKVNLFGKNKDGKWEDVWLDANGQEVNYYTDKDALKIIKEDGLPIDMAIVENTFFIGGDLTIDVDFTIVGNSNQSSQTQTTGRAVVLNGVAVAGASELPDIIVGYTAGGRTVSLTNGGINLDQNSIKYLYYPGTAPVYPDFSFKITPTVDENYYINSPRNSFTHSLDMACDLLIVESHQQKLFKFSLPGAYYGYNQAISLFKDIPYTTQTIEQEGEEPEEVRIYDLSKLRELIRGTITHKHARAWAIAVTDSFTNTNFNSERACEKMSYFITDITNGTFYTSECRFSGKTSVSKGIIGYNIITNDLFTIDAYPNYVQKNTMEENIGDMVKSDYLVLEERNYPDADGWIRPWSSSNETTRSYSYRLYYEGNAGAQLSDFNIAYKYMYY